MKNVIALIALVSLSAFAEDKVAHPAKAEPAAATKTAQAPAPAPSTGEAAAPTTTAPATTATVKGGAVKKEKPAAPAHEAKPAAAK